MKLYDLNWMQVEEYLGREDRIVLPVGSTEQHAYLSLGTDSILAERISVEAAEPLGVLVAPAMPFGIAPGFAAFPGTVTLRPQTLVAVFTETMEALRGQGFRRFLIVNGHGGNTPARESLEETGALWHDWWDSPAVRDAAAEIYPGDATHASWFEAFPWTRLAGVELPAGEKPMVTDREALASSSRPPCARRSAMARTAGLTRCWTRMRCVSGRPGSPRCGHYRGSLRLLPRARTMTHAPKSFPSRPALPPLPRPGRGGIGVSPMIAAGTSQVSHWPSAPPPTALAASTIPTARTEAWWASLASRCASPSRTSRRPHSWARVPIRPSTDAAVTWTSTPYSTSWTRRSG